MKLTNATEKACAVVAMLATQENKTPIPSSVIVKRLHISDSYTKKLLRKLVVANVITSVPGNSGGFSLEREIDKISILEIVEAIEGKVDTYPGYGTLEHAFTEFPEQIECGELVMKSIFFRADEKWRAELANQTLNKLLEKSFGDSNIVVNWLQLDDEKKQK